MPLALSDLLGGLMRSVLNPPLKADLINRTFLLGNNQDMIILAATACKIPPPVNAK
jgi:hypothetical protein